MMYLSISFFPTLRYQSHPPPNVFALVCFAHCHLVLHVIEVRAFLSVSVLLIMSLDGSKAEKGAYCDVEPYVRVLLPRRCFRHRKEYQRAQ